MWSALRSLTSPGMLCPSACPGSLGTDGVTFCLAAFAARASWTRREDSSRVQASSSLCNMSVIRKMQSCRQKGTKNQLASIAGSCSPASFLGIPLRSAEVAAGGRVAALGLVTGAAIPCNSLEGVRSSHALMIGDLQHRIERQCTFLRVLSSR